MLLKHILIFTNKGKLLNGL